MHGAREKTVAILSNVRWNFLWQRHQSLAVAAARDGWKVDFIDPHLRGVRHLATAVAGRPVRISSPVQDDIGAVRRLRPPRLVGVVPDVFGTSIASAWMDSRYSAVLLYLPSKPFFELATRIASEVVYDRVVDWGNSPSAFFPPRGWREVERSIFDLSRGGGWHVTTDNNESSLALVNQGVPARTVLPAVDDAFLVQRPPGPQSGVGYFGAIRDEVDVELILRVSSRCSVEIVGQIPSRLRPQLIAAGVSLSDTVPIEMLPERVARWKVILLPYRGARVGTLTPAKAFNAFATGAHVAVRGISLPDELNESAVHLSADDDRAAEQVHALLARPVDALKPHLPTWDERWVEMKDLAGLV